MAHAGMKEIMAASAEVDRAKEALRAAVNKALPVGSRFMARRISCGFLYEFEVTRGADSDGAINARNIETGKTWWNVNPSHEWIGCRILAPIKARNAHKEG